MFSFNHQLLLEDFFISLKCFGVKRFHHFDWVKETEISEYKLLEFNN